MRGEDRLLPHKHRTQFDYLPLCESEQKDPFCQGLRLVLNHKRGRDRTSPDEIPETVHMQGFQLRMKLEIPKRSIGSVVMRSFEIGFLNSHMKYFQNRLIAWLKQPASNCENLKETNSSRDIPAIFFWNEGIVYTRGLFKSYQETKLTSITAIDFHLPTVAMVGQRTGTLSLIDLHKEILYRSIFGESVSKFASDAAPITDLASYYHKDHSNLAFVLLGSELKGVDFSQKNAVCCQYQSTDRTFFPSKIKVLDCTKLALHGTDSDRISVWDVRKTNEPILSPSFSREIDLMDENPNDTSQIVFSSYRTVYLYSFRFEAVQHCMNFPGMVLGLTWHKDGRISVIHSELYTGLSLLKVTTVGKFELAEELRTSEPNMSSNIFTAEGCKQSSEILALGDLDLHNPGYSIPNYTLLQF